VAFDAVEQARDQQMQVLIVDTAGRLHNKSDLMNELSKIKRVIEKVAPVTEVLLVLDATTGQNAIAQARVFSESVSVTGLILTKTDGSAKGGFALAVERELGVPVKFVGTGEAIEDFLPFDSATYLQGLLEE
jgi:fused signal recognition particle receptor